MTTYILHGGKTSVDSVGNKQFFRLFTSNVLMCYFARNKSDWAQLFTHDKAIISTKANISIVENIPDLYANLPHANILYVAGGEQEYLEPYIKDLSLLKSLLNGKIYIGSSMGAFLASENYVLSLDGQHTDTVYSGLGFVPYNILCHWNIEKNKEKKIAMLKGKSPDSPILLLNEEEFTTITI